MPADRSNSKYSKYERREVLCKCRQCLVGTNGLGRKQPQYSARRHAALELAARTTEPRRLDPHYIAQPFSRPQHQHQTEPQQESQMNPQPQQQPRSITPISAGPEVESEPDIHEGVDEWNESDGEFDVDVGHGWDTTYAQVDDMQELVDTVEVPNELFEPSYVFKTPEKPMDSMRAWRSLDSTYCWRSILLLVSWLHLVYHLPFRACNLILRVLKHLFMCLKVVPAKWNPIITLQATFRKLGLEDKFLIMPMCPACRRILPDNSILSLECPGCQISLFDSNNGSKVKLKYPFYPISQQLAEMIMQPGIEDIFDSWRKDVHNEGEYRNISDGRVWNSLKAPSGGLFFDRSPGRDDSHELRIGLTLGFDGFSFTQSKSGRTHSSDAMSFSIANLPIQLRYQPRFLLLCGIAPGPKGLSSEQTQYMLQPIVDDLIRLYTEGIVVPTSHFPQGRLCRAVLIAGCMDHIALCKACAMAGHASSSDFCTKCKAPRDALKTSEGLTDAFVHRTGEENRRLAFQYRALDNDDEKKAFFDEHGVGYTELARLNYFDLVRMTVVDPMHNILLGIMRSQWHDSWIKTNALRKRTEPYLVPRELDLLNAYLKEFEMPSWVGRLPSSVGYPAAGSLSADEYKCLALVYLPVIIPFVWSEWQPVAAKDHESALKKWRKGPMTGPEPRIRMHEDEPGNFLKLAAALKLLLGRSIRDVDMERAKMNLLEYLQGYRKLHLDDLKPNFHWVVHLFDQIRDYGPVYSFWTFTFERLNKVLKSYKTNNHAGGEIEVSFFREFHRDVRLRDFVRTVQQAADGADTASFETARLILETESDCRGTVASICREIDDAALDAGKWFSSGPESSGQLTKALQKHLVKFYETNHSYARVCARDSILDPHATRSPNFLNDSVEYLKYIVLDGRRIKPSNDIFHAPNSIIQTRFNGGKIVGQVTKIIKHRQRFIEGSTILLHVYWFKPLERNVLNTSVWDVYPELEIGFFEFNAYTSEPPALLLPEKIISQACRVRILYRQPRQSADIDEEDDEPPRKIWVTVGLTKDILAI